MQARWFVVVALLGVVASPVFAANSLQVNNAAALVGNFGLEVTVDGSPNVAFVQDDTPTAETTYNMTVLFHQNTFSGTGAKEKFSVFRGLGTGSGAAKRNMKLNIKQQTAGQMRATLLVNLDSGGWVQAAGTWLPVTPKKVTLSVEWSAADPGANNGVARLLKNGVLQGELTTLDTDTKVVETARLGLTSSNNAGLSGSFFLDDFQSVR